MTRYAPSPRGHKQIVGLDLLRFAAALLVLSYHLACLQWLRPSSDVFGLIGRPIALPRLFPIAAIGWVGVPVFFVISGFVIVLTATNATAHNFLINRALRLLPCAWICATVSFAIALGLSPLGELELLVRYLRTLILFPFWNWIDGAYWSLGVEISFYAIVYALLKLDRFDKLERVITIVGLTSTLAWCLSTAQVWPGLDVLMDRRIAQLCLITHGCEFALGVLIWAAVDSGWTRRRVCVAVLCFVGALLQIDRDVRFVLPEFDPEGLLAPVVPPTSIFCGFIALFLLAIRYNDVLVRRLGRGVAWVRALGLSTYPLYLLHSFVGALAMRAACALDFSPGACLATGIAVALGMSLAVSQFAEPYLRAALRRRIERRKRVLTAV